MSDEKRERVRAIKRRSAMKRYWENPSKARADKRKTPGVCVNCGIEFMGRPNARCCTRSCSARLAHAEGRANTFKGKNGAQNYRWSGGRKTMETGYVLMWVPLGTPGRGKNSYMMEHRFVMQNHLGRPLERWEIIHHRNGVKDDNRIENLEIVTRARHRGMVTCPHCQETFAVN